MVAELLGKGRSEGFLFVPGGRQCSVRKPVVAPFECEDPRAPRCQAGGLERRLDRVGTARPEDGAAQPCLLSDLLEQLDTSSVWKRIPHGMQQITRLRPHGTYDGGMRMPHAGHTKPCSEVYKHVSINVFDIGTDCAGPDDGIICSHTQHR